jgi:hypothetical protein
VPNILLKELVERRVVIIAIPLVLAEVINDEIISRSANPGGGNPADSNFKCNNRFSFRL